MRSVVEQALLQLLKPMTCQSCYKQQQDFSAGAQVEYMHMKSTVFKVGGYLQAGND